MHDLHAPRIDASLLPDEEKEVGDVVSGALLELPIYVAQFRSALDLFDFCFAEAGAATDIYTTLRMETHRIRQTEGGNWLENREAEQDALRREGKFVSWSMIAARDAGLSVFHTGKTIEGIGELATRLRAPVLCSLIDPVQKKAAWSVFRHVFPHWEGLRHAIAHSAELTESPEKAALNTSGPYRANSVNFVRGAIVKSGLFERTLTYSHEGEMRTLDITDDSLTALEKVQEMYFAAFTKAERKRPHFPDFGLAEPAK